AQVRHPGEAGDPRGRGFPHAGTPESSPVADATGLFSWASRPQARQWRHAVPAPDHQPLQLPGPRRQRPQRPCPAAPPVPLRPPRRAQCRRRPPDPVPGHPQGAGLPRRRRTHVGRLRAARGAGAFAGDRTDHRAGAGRADRRRPPARRGGSHLAHAGHLPGFRAHQFRPIRRVLRAAAAVQRADRVPLHRRQGPHRLRGGAGAACAGRHARGSDARLPADQRPAQAARLRLEGAGTARRQGAVGRAAGIPAGILRCHRGGLRRPRRLLAPGPGRRRGRAGAAARPLPRL
ncbi:MAG: Protein tyrosine phosphatase, partial [uncultured Ramlibacter sp.]